MICPQCYGNKVTIGFACPGFRPIELECDMCRGTGEIGDEQVLWIKLGELCKDARRERGIVMRQFALESGIDASAVSRMERGVDDPASLLKLWDIKIEEV
jgi:hypothetical protein